MPVEWLISRICEEFNCLPSQAAREWLVGCMTAGMQQYLTRVPVVVDATIERDWSGTPVHAERADAA